MMKSATAARVLAASAALVLAGAVPALGATSTACPATAAKVLVTAMGNVTLNGRLVPVDNLAAALNALAPRPTEVCYFREKAPGAQPVAVRIAVNAIISTHLPISFYADASFSSRVRTPTR